MNNLEFSQLLTNLKYYPKFKFHPNKVLLTCFPFGPLFGFSWQQCYVETFICQDRQFETYESMQA